MLALDHSKTLIRTAGLLLRHQCGEGYRAKAVGGLGQEGTSVYHCKYSSKDSRIESKGAS